MIPEWQERCRAESLAAGTPTISYAHLDRLASLDLVMRECMRLVTAVPGLARKTVRDTEILGFRVPADTGVHKCIGLYFGGMQVKAAMHQLLFGHRWRVQPDYEMPIDWTALPGPKDGLPVHLKRL